MAEVPNWQAQWNSKKCGYRFITEENYIREVDNADYRKGNK